MEYLNELRNRASVCENAFNEWVTMHNVTDELSRQILELVQDDRFNIFNVIVARIQPVLSLFKHNTDGCLTSYWTAPHEVIKSLPNDAFEALLNQKSYFLDDKSNYYAYIVLRYSTKPVELAYLVKIAKMKHSARIKTQAYGGKLYNMAHQYIHLKQAA